MKCNTSMAELDTMETWQEARKLAKTTRLEAIKNNPWNGRYGWWIVQGIRHTGHAHAHNAQEAIDMCLKAGVVQDWESPEATFCCEQLPEVF